MKKQHYVGCRVDSKLFNMIDKHAQTNSYIVRKCLTQYFRAEEPNKTLDYNQDLVTHMQDEINFLRSQNQALMTASIPLLGRVKMKLIGEQRK